MASTSLGATVTFRVLQGAATLFQTTAITGSGGNAVLTPPPGPLPVGYFTVVASILGADGQVSASDMAVDSTPPPSPSSRSATADLGSSAVVKDVGGIVWAGRKVVVIVTRGGGTLHTAQRHDRHRRQGGRRLLRLVLPPSGRLTLLAELFDAAGTSVRQTATTDVAGPVLVVAPSVAFLEAKTGTTYPAFSVTVSDNRGAGGRGSRDVQPADGHAERGVHRERVEQRTADQPGHRDDERPGVWPCSDDGSPSRWSGRSS